MRLVQIRPALESTGRAGHDTVGQGELRFNKFAGGQRSRLDPCKLKTATRQKQKVRMKGKTRNEFKTIDQKSDGPTQR
jgi:hypothetical protein